MASRSSTFSGYACRLNAEKRREILKNRTGIMIFCDDMRGLIEDLGLSDEDLGKLFRLIYAYAYTGEVSDLPAGLLRYSFNIIRAGVDRASESYIESCISSAWARYCGLHKKERESTTPEDWFNNYYNATGDNVRQRALTCVNTQEQIEIKTKTKTKTKNKTKGVQGDRFSDLDLYD